MKDIKNFILENVSDDDRFNITWNDDKTEVYVDGIYAGFVQSMSGPNGTVYSGGVYYTDDNNRRDMKTFFASEVQSFIVNQMEKFIKDNYDNVRDTSEQVGKSMKH